MRLNAWEEGDNPAIHFLVHHDDDDDDDGDDDLCVQVRKAQKAIPTGLVYRQNEVTLDKIGTWRLQVCMYVCTYVCMLVCP